MRTIAGQPPDLQRLQPGCAFQPRCDFTIAECLAQRPALRAGVAGGVKACCRDDIRLAS